MDPAILARDSMEDPEANAIRYAAAVIYTQTDEKQAEAQKASSK